MTPENQPNPYKAVKEYVEGGGPKDWRHQQRAADLYSMANVMRMYFFSEKEPGQYLMPEPLVGVELLRIETLACYYLVENPLGLKYQVSMNSLYLSRPVWEQYESLAHELIHLYQENHPDLPKCKKGYHNEAFVALCEDIGLHPRLGSGCHLAPAEGQFERLMARFGIEKPEYAKKLPPLAPTGDKKKYWWDDDRGSKKGASTLLKWVCACEPPKNSVRTGRKDLMALCLSCGQMFKPEPVADLGGPVPQDATLRRLAHNLKALEQHLLAEVLDDLEAVTLPFVDQSDRRLRLELWKSEGATWR